MIGAVDYYKYTMAAAGFPLRRESFYLSMRKGGPWFLSFDIKPLIRWIIKLHRISVAPSSFLNTAVTPAMSLAMQEEVTIDAVVPGNWIMPGEPIAVITGPSFLVSKIEAEIVQLHRYIQISTRLKLAEMGLAPELEYVYYYSEVDNVTLRRLLFPNLKTRPGKSSYINLVKSRFNCLHEAAGSVPIIEAGLRSAPDSLMHSSAMSSIWDIDDSVGTSNINATFTRPEKSPVGTTGHEHFQRFMIDWEAIEAYLSRVTGSLACLVDTRDVYAGIEALYLAKTRHPEREMGPRFDSGDVIEDMVKYYDMICDMDFIILAGGMNPDLIRRAIETAKKHAIPKEKLRFMVGEYLMCPSAFRRSDVGAVYKLCKTGHCPTYKKATGKTSIPGRMILYRGTGNPKGLISQHGEDIDLDDSINLFHNVVNIPESTIKLIIQRKEVPSAWLSHETGLLMS